MKDVYTISEMAGLFNISTQTLRHYDRIGLLKPSVVGVSNKYRLYNQKNFGKLYLIMELRGLGLSLNEIREYCENKDKGQLEGILTKNRIVLDEKIAEMLLLKQRTENYLQKISLSRNDYREQFEIKQIPDRFCYFVPVNFKISDLEQYMALLLNSYAMSDSGGNGRSLSNILLTISRKELTERRFKIYNGIGFLLDGMDENRSQYKIPGGEYAVTWHIGGYDTIDTTYKKIWDCIVENGYMITGDSAEISIINMAFTDNPKDYITEVQIPIKRNL